MENVEYFVSCDVTLTKEQIAYLVELAQSLQIDFDAALKLIVDI